MNIFIKSKEKKNYIFLISFALACCLWLTVPFLYSKYNDYKIIKRLEMLDKSQASETAKKIKAIKIYADAIRLNVSEKALLECAEMFEKLLPIPHAGLAWKRLLDINPGNPYYLYFAARYNLIFGGIDEALTSIRLCIDLDPKNAAYREALAHWSFTNESSELVSHRQLVKDALQAAKLDPNVSVKEMEKRLLYIYDSNMQKRRGRNKGVDVAKTAID